MQARRASVLVFCLSVSLVGLVSGCGKVSEKLDALEDALEFAGVVPSSDSFDTTTADQESASQALTIEQAIAQPVDAGSLRQHTEEVLRGVRHLVHDTHIEVDRLIDSADPIAVEQGNLECAQWEGDGEAAHWRLTICDLEGQRKHHRVTLEGRALDANEGSEFLPVFAGEGFRHKADGAKRRARGFLRYNLDNLGTLRGTEVSGKLAVGFNAAGKGRKLDIRALEANAPDLAQPLTGRYHFAAVAGRGGAFRFAGERDLLTSDGAGGYTYGDDGQAERGRALVVWSNQGSARGVFALCGGTLGQGECVSRAQCWTTGGDVTFDAVVDGSIDWDRQACGAVPVEPTEPPTESEVEAPTEGSDGLEIDIPADSGDADADSAEG